MPTPRKTGTGVSRRLKDTAIAVIPPQHKLEAVPKKTRRKTTKKKKGSKEDGSAEDPKKSKDPVRMYLKEMGAVSLLSREGEVEIAKRIEKGQKTVLKALSRSPVVAGWAAYPSRTAEKG